MPVIRRPPLGITMGDPAGIGPEIIIKALSELPRLRCRVFGSRPVFEREQQRLGTSVDLAPVEDVTGIKGEYTMGSVQQQCGAAAFGALHAGVSMLRDGEVSALVTAPVSKEALRLAGFGWPGQTEFLARRLGAQRYAMLAWTPHFKAVFVTIHLPLVEVARRITADAVAGKTGLLHDFLLSEGKKKPRIAVLALNPHAREFSKGEEERIERGVAWARSQGVDAVGPIPADAAIARLQLPNAGRKSKVVGRFDGYVCMYHDQAMIPAKLLGRDKGVNVTLGLGHVRTSPLHGTAFDIAGKGTADPSSMLAAIQLALRLVRRNP